MNVNDRRKLAQLIGLAAITSVQFDGDGIFSDPEDIGDAVMRELDEHDYEIAKKPKQPRISLDKK